MYMYVCTYVSIYVWICGFTDVCMYAWMYVYMYVWMYV